MRLRVSISFSLLSSLPFLFSLVTSSPTPQSTLPVGYDCSKRDQSLRPECWDVLNVSQHLVDWANENTDCIPTPYGLDPAGYNDQSGSFWKCFLDRVKPVTPDPQGDTRLYNYECATLGSGRCFGFAKLTAFSPQDQFIIQTIFNIFAWFNSIYDAVGDSQVGVMGDLGSIVQLYNPPEKESLFVSAMVVAVGAAIGSLPLPIGGARLSKFLFTPSMQQFPGVLKYAFPPGTVDSRVSQANVLNEQLNWLVTATQDNLRVALQQAMNKWDVFEVLSRGAAFFGTPSDSLDQRKNITVTLNTFVISNLLKVNGIYLTLALNTNVKEMADNGTAKYSEYLTCQEYDQFGVCNAWWYDALEGNTYGLQNINKVTENYHDRMVETFSKGWTTPEMLFRGAKKCADYVFAGGDAGALIDPNGIEPRCLSTLDLCVWNQTCYATNCLMSNDYPWSDCPAKNLKQSTWLCNRQYGMFIPPAYLGPILQREKIFVCRD